LSDYALRANPTCVSCKKVKVDKQQFRNLPLKLHTQTTGNGPDLVLIHGWGLHGGIWETLLPHLEPYFRVTTVDLPGHGHSRWQGQAALAAFADAVLASAPQQAAWLGWSLGGLVALQAALAQPQRIGALLLLASTPSFVRRDGWPSAMLPSLLDTFAAELETDFERTLNRFLALQVHGSCNAGDVLRQLRAGMLRRGQPDPAALRAGLGMLHDTDLRAACAGIDCPALVLAGERDTLVPVNAARMTAGLLPRGRIHALTGAGHAPFLSAPDQVAARIRAFLQPEVTREQADG
jgi:pimeloyl-[acyl-carrier protein] methyl ester esterase